ncbi:MAG: glycosyltransferase [Flavobacteriales bacterium]|nr:glycosyltransferase [Flavobacteriales bacterium]
MQGPNHNWENCFFADVAYASDNKPVVLCWAGWFPHPQKPYEGLFVRRHLALVAEAAHLHVFTIRHRKGIFLRWHDTLEECGTVRHYEISDFFPVKLVGYLLLPMVEAWRAKSKLKRLDVFHLHVSYPYVIFSIGLSLFKIHRWVLSEHWSGYTEADGRFEKRPRLFRTVLSRAIQKFQVVMPVSHYLKAEMQKRLGLPESLFRVTPNCVSMPRKFQPPPDFSADGQPFKFLTICSLVDRIKNISFLLKSFHKAQETLPLCELYIAGDGPDREKLIRLSVDLGLQGKVHFLGRVENENISALYSECHAFVLFSRFETFSVVTAEALAHGRPVVVTACGGPEEFVRDFCGHVVSQEGEEAAAQALKDMVLGYDQWDLEKIYNYAQEKFHSEKIREALLEAYKI